MKQQKLLLLWLKWGKIITGGQKDHKVPGASKLSASDRQRPVF